MPNKINVRIEMDNLLCWWPLDEVQMTERYELVNMPAECRDAVALEIDKDLFDAYQIAKVNFLDLQDKFEQLYRVQEGMQPLGSTPIPDYKKLEV